jgi:H+-transporting ATPase
MDDSDPKLKEDNKEGGGDEEEARDVVASLRPLGGGRIKTSSDVTGVTLEGGVARPSRKDRRAVSDLVVMMNLPPEAETQIKRRRQKSSSDVITRFQEGALRDADLNFAERIQVDGTYRERQESGIKESTFVAQVEGEEEGFVAPDDFEFNHVGLTTAEAEERLKKYGKNELPEKIDPKWLIFLRLLWGPMPCLLWIVRPCSGLSRLNRESSHA